MRWLLPLALLVTACHAPTLDVTLLTSPLLDEAPLAGVDTLELRWSRPGQPRTVEHMSWTPRSRLTLTPPVPLAGAALELAAVSAGTVVAVGRSAPLAAGQKQATVYVGLVDRFVTVPSPPSPSLARYGASATRLGDGRVLFAGGATRGSPDVPDPASISAVVDLYDPATGGFSAVTTPSGFAGRIRHAAAPTADGGVWLVGGLATFGPLDDLYTFHGDSGLVAVAARLPGPRWAAAAAALDDGGLLLVGGYTSSDGAGGGTLASDAVVVAADGSATTLALPSPRAFAVATRLADGRVLVSGGVDAAGVRADALIYTPSTRSFAAPAPSGARAAMLTPRVGHSATLLASGAVLVFGGNDGHASVAAAELWSPAADGFVAAPLTSVAPRQRQAAAALADGSVLLIGGEAAPQRTATPSPLDDALYFQPTPGDAAGVLHDDLPPAPVRADATATLLGDGSLLYIGGAVGDPRTLAGGAQLFAPCFGDCLALTP
jgi:hypothetical protein